MKTWKKALAGLTAMAICSGASVALTAAYLTDRDSEANVFTVGDVTIDLTEDFDQGATLIPGVKIEKDVRIENTGKNDAWVWAKIALPAVLDNADPSKNVIHFNYTKDPGYNWTWTDANKAWLVEKETIDNIKYNVYTVLYDEVLAPGEVTDFSAMFQVYLDTAVDIDPNGDWYKVVNGNATPVGWNSDTTPIMYVSAYGIQEEGFTTVQEAYTAYGKQWGDNGDEWGEPATVVKVTDLEGLKNALANAAGDPVIVDAGGSNLGDLDDVTFGDGTVITNAVFSGDENHGSYGNDANGTVTFVNCTFTSGYAYAAHFDGGDGELVFINCTFEGWNSFGTAIKDLTFENCTFGHNGYFGLVRVYQNATFTDCTFESDFEGVDTNKTGTVVHFNNCTDIAGKIYNNGSNVGTWYVDGVQVSVTSW